MNKNNVISFICGAIIFSSVTALAQEALRIENNTYPIYVDGKEQKVEGYNINEYTYLKLSDFKKVLPVDISFDEKTSSINIKTLTDKSVETKSLTDDGLEIHYINGVGYINLFDLQDKYNCLVMGSSYDHKLKIFGDRYIPTWDLDVMQPLLDTENFSVEGNKWYFETAYYEKTVKPLLIQTRQKMQPSYTKDGIDIYVDNGVEYVLPSDISKVILGEGYSITCDINKRFTITKLGMTDDSYDSRKNKVLTTDLPGKAINGHIYMEYKYLKNDILPKIKNK